MNQNKAVTVGMLNAAMSEMREKITAPLVLTPSSRYTPNYGKIADPFECGSDIGQPDDPTSWIVYVNKAYTQLDGYHATISLYNLGPHSAASVAGGTLAIDNYGQAHFINGSMLREHRELLKNDSYSYGGRVLTPEERREMVRGYMCMRSDRVRYPTPLSDEEIDLVKTGIPVDSARITVLRRRLDSLSSVTPAPTPPTTGIVSDAYTSYTPNYGDIVSSVVWKEYSGVTIVASPGVWLCAMGGSNGLGGKLVYDNYCRPYTVFSTLTRPGTVIKLQKKGPHGPPVCLSDREIDILKETLVDETITLQPELYNITYIKARAFQEWQQSVTHTMAELKKLITTQPPPSPVMDVNDNSTTTMNSSSATAAATARSIGSALMRTKDADPAQELLTELGADGVRSLLASLREKKSTSALKEARELLALQEAIRIQTIEEERRRQEEEATLLRAAAERKQREADERKRQEEIVRRIREQEEAAKAAALKAEQELRLTTFNERCGNFFEPAEISAVVAFLGGNEGDTADTAIPAIERFATHKKLSFPAAERLLKVKL